MAKRKKQKAPHAESEEKTEGEGSAEEEVSARKGAGGGRSGIFSSDTFRICDGAGCNASLPDVRAHSHPSFHYTTPSAQPNQAKKKKVDLGCEINKRTRYCFQLSAPKNKSGIANKCYASEAEAKRQHAHAGKDARSAVSAKTDDRFSGYLKTASGERVYDTRCKGTYTKPCGDRASCPVQLVWLDGKPNLRFCDTQGQPGNLVPVKDVDEAVAYANKACEAWPVKMRGSNIWPKDFWEKNAPDVIRDARGAYPKGGPGGGGQPGLGEGREALVPPAPRSPRGEGGREALVPPAPAYAARWGREALVPPAPDEGVEGVSPDDFVEAIEPPEPFDHDLGAWSSDNILKGAVVVALSAFAYQKVVKPMLGGAK